MIQKVTMKRSKVRVLKLHLSNLSLLLKRKSLITYMFSFQLEFPEWAKLIFKTKSNHTLQVNICRSDLNMFPAMIFEAERLRHIWIRIRASLIKKPMTKRERPQMTHFMLKYLKPWKK